MGRGGRQDGEGWPARREHQQPVAGPNRVFCREVRLWTRACAVRWAVYQDPGQNGRYVESFIVESWLEHLRQHERATVGDRTVQERIRRFHIAGTPPSVTHLIAARFVTRS